MDVRTTTASRSNHAIRCLAIDALSYARKKGMLCPRRDAIAEIHSRELAFRSHMRKLGRPVRMPESKLLSQTFPSLYISDSMDPMAGGRQDSLSEVMDFERPQRPRRLRAPRLSRLSETCPRYQGEADSLDLESAEIARELEREASGTPDQGHDPGVRPCAAQGRPRSGQIGGQLPGEALLDGPAFSLLVPRPTRSRPHSRGFAAALEGPGWGGPGRPRSRGSQSSGPEVLDRPTSRGSQGSQQPPPFNSLPEVPPTRALSAST